MKKGRGEVAETEESDVPRGNSNDPTELRTPREDEKAHWGKKPLTSQLPSTGCAAELVIPAGEVRTPLRAEQEQPLALTEAPEARNGQNAGG